MKLNDVIETSAMGANVIQQCLAEPIDHGGCPYPIGQDGDPEVALLLRHFAYNHEMDCLELTATEQEFIGELWHTVFYGGVYAPSPAEMVVIRAVNRKMANCEWVENC